MPKPSAIVKVAAPLKRGLGVDWTTVNPQTCPVLSSQLTESWGSEPSESTIVYSSPNAVTIGSAIELTIGRFFFSGICSSDRSIRSSKGNTRSMTFKDYRHWLKWDKGYFLFNRLDDSLVGGKRLKRYYHIYPNNHGTLRKVWTNYPLPIWQILTMIFSGPGIETPWTFAYIGGADYPDDPTIRDGFHPGMNYPIYDFDGIKGKSLTDVLLAVTEATGLLFTLLPTPDKLFRLVWAMKGVDGDDITAPANSDDRETGLELSNNPTRVRVLGERNVYQMHDIVLEPDWNRNWDRFFDINLFADFIFQNGSDVNGAGAYTGIAGDTEQIIGRQLALGRALEITLRQFDDTFRGVNPAGYYLDNRHYSGKLRSDMPVVVYLRNLLFRAFRLQNSFRIRNTYGQFVYRNSVEVIDKLIADVTYDPVTGETFYDPDASSDGSNFVLVRGYQVGKDLFESINPDRFDITQWKSTQDIWQKIEAQVENENDDVGPCIIMAEPVIRSEDLVDLINGAAVIRANPTITVPSVRAILTFQCELFSWFQTLVADPDSPPTDPVMGTQTHDEVLAISGLNGEFVRQGNAIYEIPYANGKNCRTLAIEYANNFLARQAIHATGTFKLPLDSDTLYWLTGKIDRINIDYSTSGFSANISLTNERPRETYVPERDLDRMQQLRGFGPGEQEARKESRYARKIAAVARTSPDAYKLMSEAFKGSNWRDGATVSPIVVQGCAEAGANP